MCDSHPADLKSLVARLSCSWLAWRKATRLSQVGAVLNGTIKHFEYKTNHMDL